MPHPAAILDVDGTLVDNNYQHALAWHLAFRRSGLELPLWRAHRAVGVGGDKFVSEVADEETEHRHGDAVREAESEIFAGMIGEVAAIEGATELVRELKDRGHRVFVASSGSAGDIEYFLDLLDLADVIDGMVSADDVEASKPDPDLIDATLERAGGGPALMVGDTGWDIEAAERAGLETIAVLTGGVAECELRAAGAAAVYPSVAELRADLDNSPFAV